MIIALACITALLYAACSYTLLRHWREELYPAWFNRAGGLALLLHTVVTAELSFSTQGVQLSLLYASNMVSWWVVLIAFVSARYIAVQKLLLPVYVLALVNVVAASLAANQNITVLSIQTALHVLPSITAYSIFTLAAINACLLWMQNRALKQHLNRMIGGLPPLEALESLLFVLVASGLVLLSIGIVSGFVFIDDFMGQHLAHKTVFSILAWVTFAALLAGHRTAGWRGEQAARWTLAGYTCLMLGFYGSKFVLEVLLPG